MKQYLYLFINVGCIIIPFIFSFLLKHKFYKQWRYFIPANIIIAILFIIWDHIFVEMGVWGFRSDYQLDYLSLRIFHLRKVCFLSVFLMHVYSPIL